MLEVGDAGLERRGGIGYCLLMGTGCVEDGEDEHGVEVGIGDVGVPGRF